jgi:hypothetical protein
MAASSKLRFAGAVLAALTLLAVGALASGCGSATDSPSEGSGAAPVPTAAHAGQRTAAQPPRAEELQRLRDAIIRGEAREYSEGTRAGGTAFQACFRGALREALDPAALARLVGVYRRPYGQQFTAQALTALAEPSAARCGHPHLLGEMVDASRALRAGRLTGAAVRKLGVTYGPYLGVRCLRPGRIGCDRVGIDIVFRRATTRVVALVGDRRLRLHTPGMHDGVRRHDWVGTLDEAGMTRKGSPFYIEDTFGAAKWAGYPPVYVPIEFRVAYADGRRARARFAGVFLSPGWG